MPELEAYALTQSFSHTSHQSGHNFSSPIAIDMDTISTAGFQFFAPTDNNQLATKLHKEMMKEMLPLREK